jgi:hypothetical protein
MRRVAVAGTDVVDVATGEVVGELGRKWTVEADRPRTRRKKRLSKKVRDQIQLNVVIAAGVVLGCWLPFARWSL